MKLRPSPSLVISFIALLVALGGTGYAAFRVPKNSVGSKQLKNNAVTTKKIKNGAVTAAKLAVGSLTPSGPAGGDLTGSYPRPDVHITLPAPIPLALGTGWDTPSDGEASATCYEDREGVVHFSGGIHSEPGAQPTMATLPALCPPPASNVVVQTIGNLSLTSETPYAFPITINTNGTLTNSTGTAGNGSTSYDNLTLTSITYRAR